MLRASREAALPASIGISLLSMFSCSFGSLIIWAIHARRWLLPTARRQCYLLAQLKPLVGELERLNCAGALARFQLRPRPLDGQRLNEVPACPLGPFLVHHDYGHVSAVELALQNLLVPIP